MNTLKLTALSLFAALAAAATSSARGEDCAARALESYLATQDALASDDLESARAASRVECEGGAELEAQLKAASAVAEAEDLAAARSAFLAWSEALLAKVESDGAAARAVDKVHCPMAFGGKGGSWLQVAGKTRNPYYGASMLACGVKKASYPAR